jgi:biotin carboxylase
MSRRILILGGSRFQLPLIRCARERGLHVITCDYLPENPGHKLADEYHNVSTTDREAVLALARRIGIDAVASFSSDPAMPAVAYVADALGLPGPPLAAIVKLTEKDTFRGLMSAIGLRTPAFHVLAEADGESIGAVAAMLSAGRSPQVVKPVDSSGSRGITVLQPGCADLPAALQRAFDHSLVKRCIIEEYIDGTQVHGDGFLQDGRLVHHCIGDQAFYTGSRNSIPISTRYPTRHGEAIVDDLVRQVEAIARASGYLEGPVNIEARVTADGDVYVIEIGPRNGGSHIPTLLQRLTGFDFVGRLLDSALGAGRTVEPVTARRGVGAVYVLHADRDGVFAGLGVSDAVKDKVFLLDVFKQAGEPVRHYTGSNTAVGCALLQFDSLAESDRLMARMPSHLAVLLR